MANADFRMISLDFRMISLEATTKSLKAADHDLFWTRHNSYSKYGLHSKQSLRCFTLHGK